MPQPKNQFLSARVACMLVASLVTASWGRAAEVASAPKLLVNILVQGLENDKIELLKETLGPNGFKRFLSQGAVINDLDFGPGLDAAAASTMIMTGAAPVVNGVAGLLSYDISKKVEYPVFAGSSRSDYSDVNFSPAAILVSTLSDEARIATDATGKVFAVSPDAWQAVIMAGHSGNGACYIDNNTGKWVLPKYYHKAPNALGRRNSSLSLATRLDTITWGPSIKMADYPGVADYKKQFPFKYTFPHKDSNRFVQFKNSAPGNREVTQMALDLLQTEQMGENKSLDVLNIGYTLSPYPYGKSDDVEVEQLDAYLRMDADLASLFNAIEQGPGWGNTVVMLSGLPQNYTATRASDIYNIPTGQFSPQRAISLLNLYLMALHGNGDYVTGYHKGFFYLNRDFIREKGLSLQEVRIEAADFLSRMSGLCEAYTLDDIRAGRAGDEGHKLRMNTSASMAGDVLVHISPGWEVTDDIKEGKGKKHNKTPGKVTRAAITTAPAYVLAPGIKPQTITEKQDARVMAPSLARLLRIRAPNASSLPPIRFSSSK